MNNLMTSGDTESHMTYVPRTFTVPCDDGHAHEFDGFEAEGTGLGYYINPPVEASFPEYLWTPRGLYDASDKNWYIIVHTESGRRISKNIIVVESVARRVLEEVAGLIDWTRPEDEIKEMPGLAEKIVEVFERLSVKERRRVQGESPEKKSCHVK
jgi:hypothetical protein